ncbi:MAG: hypothetical protein IJU58_01535 [Clostridia bacterium]|nr:hypothetical protein [Clostridia bacterium]
MTKTKNLFMTAMIAVAMMFAVVFGFAACGETPNGDNTQNGDNTPAVLTEADVIGTWQVTNGAFTPTPENQYNTEAATCTKAQYDAIAAKVEASTALTEDESYLYYEVFDGFFNTYQMAANHDVTIVGYVNTVATWSVTDGVFTYTSANPNDTWTYAVAWTNNQVVVTITIPNAQGATMAGTMVLTLTKVVAA